MRIWKSKMMSIKLSPKTDLKTKGKTRSKLETVSLIMFPIFFEGHIFLNIAVMCYPVIIRDLAQQDGTSLRTAKMTSL